MSLFVNFLSGIFETKKKMQQQPTNIVWEGTISSDGPDQQGPVTVLKLKTKEDEDEWIEGHKVGKSDAEAGKEMCPNLNYPFHPYARGYVEGYRYYKEHGK